jgi:hypothetical protein
MLKKKINQFGTPRVALEIFSKFAGDKQTIRQNAEEDAIRSIENSLVTYGKNIFAIRVEMPSGEIIWQNSMQNVLGRTDITRYDQFQSCMHEDYLAGYNFWSDCLFEVIAKNNFNFEGLVFHIRVPFKNRETTGGKYHWYNQHSISLIADAKGSVLSFLSIYTYDSECYEGNPIIMLPSISHNNKMSYLDKTLKNLGGLRILQHTFTEMERNILTCYAENIKPSSRFQTMSKTSIYEHNVNILKKAKSIFQFSFSKAEDVAKFLKSNEMWQTTRT